MIKLLYSLFKRQLNRLVWEEGHIHGNWMDKCRVYYVDTPGFKYYLPIDHMDLPMQRYEYLQGLLTVYEMGFNSKDFDLFIKEMQEEVTKTVNDVNYRGKGLAKVNQYILELDQRRELRIEPKALLEMMACILIREDEQFEVMDARVQDMKVAQFMADGKERDNAFFLQAGLGTYIPWLKCTKTDWEKFLSQSRMELERSQKVLNMLSKQ